MGKIQWNPLVKLIFAMLIITPLLTGCWDRLEIEDRAVVLGISIDEAVSKSNGDEVAQVRTPPLQTGLIRVAIQIALPGRIALGPSESGGGGKGSSQDTLWIIDVVGYSIDDAIMNLQQQISSPLFFGHLRVIVVSEKVAKKGIENVNDYFHRNSEVRRMAWLMISKGKAMELMKAAPKLERVPTLYLISTLDESIKMGKFPMDYIGIFWSNSAKKGQEGFLPYVDMKKEQNVEVMGMAYFRGYRMVGKTKPLQIGAYMGIKGLNPAGYRVFVDLGGPSKTVMTATTHRDSKMAVQIINGHPHFSIRIASEINLEEKISEAVNINVRVLKQIQQSQKVQATKLYEALIKKTQESGSDIFGFGEFVRAKKPRYWNTQIKTKERWQEMYKEVTFDFYVKVSVRRVGMKSK
ncbi:Ger(x)C family spore germination protein [Paenibacillus solisilvae]|uniref:Ger(X)C family spore germination protein n=1 Tax=Paenibacillus solisilvae TaxID=2486751 RepID=A0ABW0W744_9BACL